MFSNIIFVNVIIINTLRPKGTELFPSVLPPLSPDQIYPTAATTLLKAYLPSTKDSGLLGRGKAGFGEDFVRREW